MAATASMATKAAGKALPLLDLAQWRRHPLQFANAFRQACHEIGFFLLRVPATATATTTSSSSSSLLSPNHIADRALTETRQFFQDLSMEQKLEISYAHNPSFRGYMAQGTENTAGKVDWREQIEYAREYDECGESFHTRNDDDDDDDESSQPSSSSKTRAKNANSPSL